MKKLNRQILSLAVPNIISNITVPLLGIVDTALMGHMESLAYVSAIALGSMIFNFIYWGFGFLRMGTVGFTAQAYGANDNKESIRILYRGLVIAGFLSLLILLTQYLVLEGGLALTSSSSQVEDLAREYFYIRVWAAPASLAILVFSGWFIGMQNSVFPMIVAIVSNILNIGFNFLFVFGFEMKSDGVALATVLAQYLSLIVILVLFIRKYRHLLFKAKVKVLMQWSKLKRFTAVNSDIFIRTLGIIFVFSFFTVRSANIDDQTLAVNSILFQFFMVFSYLMDGFANAAEALSGKAIGQNDGNYLKRIIRRVFVWGLGFSVFFTISYALGNHFFIGIMTDIPELANAAEELIVYVLLMPLVSFAAFLLDGIFVGATASKAMRNTMLAATLLVFVPIHYFAPLEDIHRLWVAFLAFMLARGVFLGFAVKKHVYGAAQDHV